MKTHYSEQNRTMRILGNYADDKPLMDEIAEAQARDKPVHVKFEHEKLCGDVKEFDPNYDLTHGQPEWMAVLENVKPDQP
jgi:hypothetical protein